jgi:D-lactate dehydrogenase (cytochrome)
MQVKTQADELQNYLIDASNLPGGFADKLFIPESAEEIAEILKQANERKIPVTISGARTGTVGGAIPFGGFVISLEKLDKIIEINREEKFATVESGVILKDFQTAVEAENLFYPPDPTEWSCQIGGTVATNASGARSFKYGATRNFVEELEIVLANGEILDLERGGNFSEKFSPRLRSRISPSAKTTSSFSTKFLVAPYLKLLAPEAFVATVPPI